jgi:hypothetical protein
MACCYGLCGSEMAMGFMLCRNKEGMFHEFHL